MVSGRQLDTPDTVQGGLGWPFVTRRRTRSRLGWPVTAASPVSASSLSRDNGSGTVVPTARRPAEPATRVDRSEPAPSADRSEPAASGDTNEPVGEPAAESRVEGSDVLQADPDPQSTEPTQRTATA